MRFRVLAIWEMEFQTILRRMELFERVKTMSGFAVCEKKLRNHCLVRSSASMTAASREMSEDKEGV